MASIIFLAITTKVLLSIGTILIQRLEQLTTVGHGLSLKTKRYSMTKRTHGWCMAGSIIGGKRYHFNESDGHLDTIYGNNIVVDHYVNWTLGIAEDDSHGYDQLFRWNELGDYDCSSLVVSALRQAGLDTGGAT